MGLLTRPLFSFLYASPGNKSLYTSDNDNFLEQNAIKQFQPTAPALPLVLAPLWHEIVKRLQKERSVVKRWMVIQL